MTSPLRHLASELRTDIFSKKLIPALSAGLSAGLNLLVAQIAFGSFIFSGSLASYSSQGIGLILFGNFATCLIIALLSGYRGAISGLPPTLVILITSLGATTIHNGEAHFVTMVCALVLSSIGTGIFYLLIGHFRIANFVRFIPYPVAGGFVAGIGGAVIMAALSLTGAKFPKLLDPLVLLGWCPGLLFGIALYLSMKRWSNVLILPASVSLAMIAYHLLLSVLNISGEEARAAGLLLTSTTDGSLWPVLGLWDVLNIEWGVLLMQIPIMLTLILVAFIGMILNLASLEMATNEELNWDREFMASGLGTLISGLGGGGPGFLLVSTSLRSKLMGANTRLTGVIAALVIGSTLFAGDGMLELVPVPIVGGVLFFAGFGMLDESLLRSWKRLPWSEYSIILLSFVAITTLGIFEGVAVGMIATLVFFILRLSRIELIESRFTAQERQSSKARNVPDRAILQEEGERVRGYQLQGYIFFGSAYPLAEHLRESLKNNPSPTCLILDFSNVSGFDFSAINVLSRIVQSADKAKVQVILSTPSEYLQSGLKRNLSHSDFGSLLIEPNLDCALERSEDIVIALWRLKTDTQGNSLIMHTAADDLIRQFEHQNQFENLIEDLQDWVFPRDYSKGDVIVGPGISRSGLQFLVSGRASVYNSSGSRIHQHASGSVIWPDGAHKGIKVTVVADETCQVMVLEPVARYRLECNEEQIALKLYRYLLSEHFGAESYAIQQRRRNRDLTNTP